MILDLFAGPGGWDEGLRLLGHDGYVLGIEHDEDACATRAAEGHATIRADVSTVALAPLVGRVDGLIGSPPCPTFSKAGDRSGLLELPHLVRHVHRCRVDGWSDYVPPASLGTDDEFGEPIGPDPRSRLVLEPLRWAWALRPGWLALEEVPDVLPIWQAIARALEQWGWRTWCRVLNAADYGVPQTRERAFLLAARGRPVQPPEPSHCRGGASTLLGDLAPWVSMAEALGWGEFTRTRYDSDQPLDTAEPAPTVCGRVTPAWMFEGARAAAGATRPHRRLAETPAAEIEVGFPRLDDLGTSPDGYRERDWRPATEPAQTMGEKARSMVVRTGNQTATVRGPEPYERSVDEPSPTLTANVGAGWRVWGDRPATTVQGDARLWPPAHKVNADDERRLGAEEANERYGDRAGTEALRLELDDALVLQSFRRDYRVRGRTKTSRFRQVGNAVPPFLAAAVLGQLLP